MSRSLVSRFARASLAAACLCVAGFASAQAQIPIRIGYATPANGAHAAAARGFEEALEELAPGRFTIEHFPGGSLGGERELAEALQLGSLEMAVIGSSVLGNFVPEMMVTELPFLFRSTEHARAVLDGDVGKDLLTGLEQAGIVGLGFGEIGFRHTTNSKRPIRSVEDLEGLKIRTVENPVPLAAWRALGALPTPMAFPEVYSALQQGIIDGQENPISIIIPSKLYEPNKYLSLTRHGFTPIVLLFSKSIMDGYSEADQEAIRKAARAGVEANRRFVDQAEKDGLAELESMGVEIVRDIDTTEFEARTQSVYKQYEETLGEIVARIKAVQ